MKDVFDWERTEMKKSLLFMFLASCSGEEKVTKNITNIKEQTRASLIENQDELPLECENGEVSFSKEDKKLYTCVENYWSSTDSKISKCWEDLGDVNGDGVLDAQDCKGDPGTSCTVKETEEGSKEVVCNDGTSTGSLSSCSIQSEFNKTWQVCSDGTRTEIVNGKNCEVFRESGTAVISCPNGLVHVQDGRNGDKGKDGDHCFLGKEIEKEGRKFSVLECTDGSKNEIPHGKDGVSCSTSKVGDQVMVQCGNKKNLLQNGKDGRNGSNGKNGANGKDGRNGVNGKNATCSASSNSDGGASIKCNDNSKAVIKGLRSPNGLLGGSWLKKFKMLGNGEQTLEIKLGKEDGFQITFRENAHTSEKMILEFNPKRGLFIRNMWSEFSSYSELKLTKTSITMKAKEPDGKQAYVGVQNNGQIYISASKEVRINSAVIINGVKRY